MEERIKRLSLGRRAAYLRKCVKVQQLCATHENQTTIRKQVFELHIKPVIMCSYQQFNNMLNERNPERELKEIEAELTAKSNSNNL